MVKWLSRFNQVTKQEKRQEKICLGFQWYKLNFNSFTKNLTDSVEFLLLLEIPWYLQNLLRKVIEKKKTHKNLWTLFD